VFKGRHLNILRRHLRPTQAIAPHLERMSCDRTVKLAGKTGNLSNRNVDEALIRPS
jgi:hypothetical protein